MQANWTVLSLTIVYMAVMGVISYYAKRLTHTAKGFTSGGTGYPAVLVGFLLMSEFIGTTASVGTTQAAYKWGISAAWNIAVLGIGFLLYGLLFARKFKELGENTISGALSKTYGEATKLATSVIMIFALQIVGVSLYASGGAVLAGLLNVDRNVAIVITGVVAVLYVSMGGMRSVIYTNVVHAIMNYLGVTVGLAFAMSRVGGWS
jgi:SSS family solute:Na+ symporter